MVNPIWRLSREAVLFGCIATLPVLGFHYLGLTFCEAGT